MTERLRPISDALHARLLKSAGYKRRANTWNRRVGELVDVVNVQLSKGLDVVWVNLGVADPIAYERVWREPLGAFVPEPSCTVRLRLGELMGEWGRSWAWDGASTADDIAADLEPSGFEFFDRMRTPEAMVDFLEHRPYRLYVAEAMYLAILLERVGRRNDACAFLHEYESRTRVVSAWNERVEELERELGCSPAGGM